MQMLTRSLTGFDRWLLSLVSRWSGTPIWMEPEAPVIADDDDITSEFD